MFATPHRNHWLSVGAWARALSPVLGDLSWKRLCLWACTLNSICCNIQSLSPWDSVGPCASSCLYNHAVAGIGNVGVRILLPVWICTQPWGVRLMHSRNKHTSFHNSNVMRILLDCQRGVCPCCRLAASTHSALGAERHWVVGLGLAEESRATQNAAPDTRHA